MHRAVTIESAAESPRMSQRPAFVFTARLRVRDFLAHLIGIMLSIRACPIEYEDNIISQAQRVATCPRKASAYGEEHEGAVRRLHIACRRDDPDAGSAGRRAGQYAQPRDRVLCHEEWPAPDQFPCRGVLPATDDSIRAPGRRRTRRGAGSRERPRSARNRPEACSNCRLALLRPG